MGVEEHPNVFRFEGRLWVSALPREEMHAQFAAQRAWDAARFKAEHWGWAIALGALAGCAATLLLGSSSGVTPATYLLVLPIGFGVGAVLGAVVNKRIRAVAVRTETAPPRPILDEVTRIPPAVARQTDADTAVADLIEWSRQGFVPGD